MIILTGRYVLPISAPPIREGGVAIESGAIAAVGPFRDLISRYPDAEVSDVRNAAILPGFINCHSHLELTALRGSLDAVEHDFRAWLLKLNALRSGLSSEDIEISALAGAVEGVRAGVTCFGDVGRIGSAGLKALRAAGLRGVVFQETEFSPDDRTAGDDWAALKHKFEDLKAHETSLVEVGISPHSPYTVSRKLFGAIAEFAAAEDVKLAIHAAESADEDRLMETGSGFFSEIYAKFGLEWTTPGTSSVRYLESTGVLGVRPLLIHCATVTAEDLRLISLSGAKIAHCPKSNAKFGHGSAPFERMLDLRIEVGLGSDSVASNNICDLLEEARFASLTARNREGSRRFISAEEVLRCATAGGAAALGLYDKVGTLEAGKQADMTAVSLKNIAQLPISDIHSALVFASSARDVILTMVAGKEIYRDGEVLTVDESSLRAATSRLGSGVL